MNKTYHYNYEHHELIISNEQSSLGYSYPRVFYAEPLAKYGYVNYDVTLDAHFNMTPRDWLSWFDYQLIEVSNEVAFLAACKESGLNGHVMMQWITDNVTPQYNEKEFFEACTAHGGNLTAMLLSGIKKLYPSVWEQLPDVQYTFSEACFLIDVLVTDKDPTYCGVKVNKHLDLDTKRMISYNAAGFHIEDAEIDGDRPMRDVLDDWYINNTDVTRESIDEFEAEQRCNQLANAARTAMNRAVQDFNAQATTGLRLDQGMVWLKAWYDAALVDAVYSCSTLKAAEEAAVQYFEEIILEMPLSQVLKTCCKGREE